MSKKVAKARSHPSGPGSGQGSVCGYSGARLGGNSDARVSAAWKNGTLPQHVKDAYNKHSATVRDRPRVNQHGTTVYDHVNRAYKVKACHIIDYYENGSERVIIFAKAPCLRSVLPTFSLPCVIARWIGIFPFLSLTSISAPRSASASTTSTLPPPSDA